ncbi:MAG: SLC26A/SulP transporter family protein [Rhodospirillales bacterium]|nr:SLC26A/SulP transporter family protein [Rhodospirillales bacterium]
MSDHTRYLTRDFGRALTSWKFIQGEFSGALSTFLIALPYSICYGLIAFSPFGPQSITAGIWAGLIGSFVLGLSTPLLGGTPGLMSVSRASTAIIFASLMETLLHHGMSPEVAITLGFVAVALAGLLQMLLGVFRIGILVKYIPQPVTSGVVTAAALLIILSQLSPIAASFAASADGLLGSRLAPIGLMIFVVVLILSINRFKSRVPAALAGILISTALYHFLISVYAVNLGDTFPAFTVNANTFLHHWQHLPAAVIDRFGENVLAVFTAGCAISVLSSIDVMIAGAVHERLSFQRGDGNRDLIAHGWANILCGFVGGLPGGASITCTLNCHKAGGRTAVAAVLAAFLLMAFVLLVGESLDYLPEMVVAGMLVVVGIEQIDRPFLQQISRLLQGRFLHWRAIAPDLALTSLVVLTGLVFNLVAAIGSGIVWALIYFAILQARAFVRRTHYGDITRSRTYRDHASEQYLNTHGRRICILELDGALFFGSADQLHQHINSLAGDGVQYIILDMRRVSSIDITGVEALKNLHYQMGARDLILAVSHVAEERRESAPDQEIFRGEQKRKHWESREIWQKLKENEALDVICLDHFFADTDAALAACEDRILADAKTQASTVMKTPPVVLNGLSKQEIRQVRAQASRVQFSRGSQIFRQGDVSNDVYFLLRGRADIIIDLVGTDRKIRIHSLRPGTLFGEMALLDSRERSATVVAAENCDCYRLSVASYQQLKKESPQLVMKLLENIGHLFADRLRDANALVRELEK